MTRQQEYEARLLLQTRQIRICRIMILILFLSLWELTTSLGLINRFIFSSPSQILFCLWNMLLDKSLFLHTGVTLTETLLSFLLCTLISLLTALFLWSSPFAAQIFEPFLVLLNRIRIIIRQIRIWRVCKRRRASYSCCLVIFYQLLP